MGVTCGKSKTSVSKTNSTKTSAIIQESVNVKLSMDNQEVKCITERTKELLNYSKLFCEYLDLIGNMELLSYPMQEQIRFLQMQRQNIDILTQNSLRRVQRANQILRPMKAEDTELLHQDYKFQKNLLGYLRRVALTVKTFDEDEDFEGKFPILCVNFKELAESILKF